MLSIFLIGVIITGATSVDISIQPRRGVVRPGDSTYVICKAPIGVKLKACWFYIAGMPGIDLSRGRESQATEEYGYFGRGLERSECGINLLRVSRDCASSTKMRTVTCAVLVEGEGWSVAYTSLLVTGEATFPLNIEPPKIKTNVGANVTIVCQAPGFNLTKCLFQGRNLGSIDLSHGHRQLPMGVATNAVGRVHYFGEGLEEGDCGITLTNVPEDWNGLVWCAAKSDHNSWGYDYTTLEVARPPSPPILKLSTAELKLHETLKATCTVKTSRPAVKMFWDAPFDEGVNKVYSTDILDARLDYEDRAVTQEMTKRVTETDHLKNVRCVVRYNNNKDEAGAQQEVKVRFCGRRNFRDATPLVYNGVVARHGEFPWHVALYKKINANHSYTCGGSLVSTKHVISAAHCFWDVGVSRAGVASSYAVAANKYHRDWLEDSFAQRFDVAELKLHDRYQHDKRRFEDDIAIVVLSAEVVLSADVHPICLDWSMTYEASFLVTGKSGTIPGWGYTENSTLGNKLRYVELPYVEMFQCLEAVPAQFQLYLSPGKFCAGFVNQSTSICTGDSGGGLVFSQNLTAPNYLVGIASIAPKGETRVCNAQQISGFTTVSSYYPWIKAILDSDDVDHVEHTNV